MKLKILLMVLMLLAAVSGYAQSGPADHLWEMFKKGQFEDVVREGKVELTTGTPTAQVNLAVGRSLVALKKFDESVLYLETAIRMDPAQTWVYAWGKVDLGSAQYNRGQMAEAQTAWIQARDCGATRNATRNADGFLKLLGMAEFYEGWREFSSEHFIFRFSSGLDDFDDAAFARRHEEAFAVICAWFGKIPASKIIFFVWTDKAEARAANMPPLGFARPELYLVHATVDQTVGHEMTHVISDHALSPVMKVGLINEGTSVYHDQTGRDMMALARTALESKDAPGVQVSVAALWEDWSLLPVEISYPLSGAWVKFLIDKGGKEKFLDFFRDQRLTHARRVYGADLQDWMEDFTSELYE